MHVIDVKRTGSGLVLTVETPPQVEGCRRCAVIAVGHGRKVRVLHDIPSHAAPLTIIWRRRRWVCPDPACPAGTFTEDVPTLARRRARLTTRAIWWAIRQLRREHASIAGLARQLGVDWHTLWESVRPVLDAMAKDESRFAGVSVLGVDEHLWHHTPQKIKE